MPRIIVPPPWRMAEREATPEAAYLTGAPRGLTRPHRRQALRCLGAAALALGGRGARAAAPERPPAPQTRLFSAGARRGPFVLDRPLTEEAVAASHNNFYEFTTDKQEVWRLARGLTLRPWTIELTGLLERPQVLDLEALCRRLPLEERLYRHRCVEAWAMAVPWIGFPLRELVKLARPLSSARYLRLVSRGYKKEMPGIGAQPAYPWPYFEGLRLAEAMNDLAFAVTGVYGHDLPPQHGAPLRLAIPWKYGYKSPKSIVKIEFCAEQPETFWHLLEPGEYPFESNVDPTVPHPRWSQATERLIGTGERRPTLPYNGYGAQVAHLYKR